MTNKLFLRIFGNRHGRTASVMILIVVSLLLANALLELAEKTLLPYAHGEMIMGWDVKEHTLENGNKYLISNLKD